MRCNAFGGARASLPALDPARGDIEDVTLRALVSKHV